MSVPPRPETSPRAAFGDVDALEALRRREVVDAPARRRPWSARVTMAVVGLGALGALYGLAQPLLFPPRKVRLADVRVAQGGPARSTAVAEAAGWLEADPYPVTVRPLVKGVVKSLAVLDGQEVVGGETVIAVLENVDLENALIAAEATLAAREADVAVDESHLAQRKAQLKQRLVQRTETVRQEGELRSAKAGAGAARALVREAEARLATTRVELDALLELRKGGGSTPIAEETARQRVRESEASVAAREAEAERATAEVARIEGLLALAREGEASPVDLMTEVPAHETHVVRAQAERDLAKAQRDVARRNVALLTVRAPVSGRVLRLLTTPGSVAGPMEQMRTVSSEAEGTTSTGVLDVMVGGLAVLYDPMHLQARIDVPLQDVARLVAGTEVEVAVPAIPERTFRGTVTRVAHEANILKATLQVKVRIEDPVPALRPEMLAKAKFLVKAEAAAPGETAPARVLVPTEAVRDGAVFVLDPRGGGRARRVAVTALGVRGDATEVEAPLGLSHRVILDPVEDGERVEAPR